MGFQSGCTNFCSHQQANISIHILCVGVPVKKHISKIMHSHTLVHTDHTCCAWMWARVCSTGCHLGKQRTR